jgi:uncharacterized protein YjbI with pentapeptide repeats
LIRLGLETETLPPNPVQLFMANAEHLALLQQGTEIRNEWRLSNPGSLLDLSGANLFGAYLMRADLSGADLSNSDLRGADFSEANLRGANFCGQNLSGASFSKQNLSEANSARRI